MSFLMYLDKNYTEYASFINLDKIMSWTFVIMVSNCVESEWNVVFEECKEPSYTRKLSIYDEILHHV